MPLSPALSRLAVAAALVAPFGALAQDDRASALIDTLGLTEPRFEDDRRNPDLHGALPGGVQVEIEFHRDGSVEEIEAAGREPFPASAIAPLLPEAVRNAPEWPADARLWSIEFDADGIEIEGVDASGRAFESEFASDGSLLDHEIDD